MSPAYVARADPNCSPANGRVLCLTPQGRALTTHTTRRAWFWLDSRKRTVTLSWSAPLMSASLEWLPVGQRRAGWAGEPRAQFAPQVPLTRRYEAHAAELGVSMRTIQQWVADFHGDGEVGLARRNAKRKRPLGMVDDRWAEIALEVLEHRAEGHPPLQVGGGHCVQPVLVGPAGKETLAEDANLAAGHEHDLRAGAAYRLGTLRAIGEERQQMLWGRAPRTGPPPGPGPR